MTNTRDKYTHAKTNEQQTLKVMSERVTLAVIDSNTDAIESLAIFENVETGRDSKIREVPKSATLQTHLALTRRF